MRLTRFSNYAVRVLMYCGLRGTLATPVPEMARSYGISYDHLKKAASELCRFGYLEAVRGRGGGVRLARPAEAIRLGEVIRLTEGEIVLVECFSATDDTCPLTPACGLRRVLVEALAAFYAVLDRYTLADLIDTPAILAPLIGLPLPDETAEDPDQDAPAMNTPDDVPMPVARW